MIGRNELVIAGDAVVFPGGTLNGIIAPNGAAAPSPGQVTAGNDTLGGNGYPHGALKGQKPNKQNRIKIN